MRTYFSLFLSLLLLIGCKSDTETNSIRVFHSVAGTNELTLEMNGKAQDKKVSYGTLSDEYEVEIGSNTFNLIEESATTNPVASFKGEIDAEEKLTILFTGYDEENQQNSFPVASNNLPSDAEPGEAYVRFIQGSPNGDSVSIGLFKDSVSTESIQADFTLSYSDKTDFIKIPVKLGQTSSYIIRVIDDRENESFDKTFIIKNEEIISFLYYGNPSVIGGFEIKGFIENF